jgi:manganese/zinc/iron transport system permease protein
MLRGDVLAAIGGGWLARRALKRLIRTREVIGVMTDEGAAVRLTPNGLSSASQLVGSHRLWETYLSKHFDLAVDHLHAPAERMEHFITSEMQAELREQLTEAQTDPHGKPIPAPDEP